MSKLVMKKWIYAPAITEHTFGLDCRLHSPIERFCQPYSLEIPGISLPVPWFNPFLRWVIRSCGFCFSALYCTSNVNLANDIVMKKVKLAVT